MELTKLFEWAFNGIGTTVFGVVVSFAIGYKLGVYQTVKQTQSAGNLANQSQVANVYTQGNNTDSENDKGKVTTTVVQNQKAGNNAVQKQVGGYCNVRK